jgi:nucleotide-binding universal stress UspA family protein
MKKIILAFDGRHFSEGAFRMAEWLNEKQAILATGVFLSPVDYREIIGYSGMGIGAPVVIPMMEPTDAAIAENIRRFEDRCNHSNMEFRVHRDTDLFALSELITETRFSDLLILSSEMFYENIDKDQPNDYLKKTLHQSECPVLLVPEKFEEPKSLVLAYDGKAASVYAIKQFAYLFPELGDLGALLVSSVEEKEEIPQMDYITELTARHYSNLTIYPLESDPRKHFSTWIGERKNTLLVTGAFGRGELSSIFRKSFVTDVIKAHRVPIFISHR